MYIHIHMGFRNGGGSEVFQILLDPAYFDLFCSLIGLREPVKLCKIGTGSSRAMISFRIGLLFLPLQNGKPIFLYYSKSSTHVESNGDLPKLLLSPAKTRCTICLPFSSPTNPWIPRQSIGVSEISSRLGGLLAKGTICCKVPFGDLT